MTLLREREFRNFWLAQSISLLGDQVAVLALPLVAVLVLDAGPGQMGLLGAAALFPHLLFSLPAGVWLDRVASRRRVMMAADQGRAALAATIPLANALDALTLVQLYAVAVLSGSLAVLFDLSYPTLVVSLAPRERYLEGNSLIHGSRSVSTVAGPSLGASLLGRIAGAWGTRCPPAISAPRARVPGPVASPGSDRRTRVGAGDRA